MLLLFISLVLADMNGQYFMSAPDGKHIPFPGHRGKYFDIYSYNISTRYSEVYWTMQPQIPLPEDFVKEFSGKLVAITGYEVDSVRTFPNGTEQSVPITHQYNHHHNAYLMGESARLLDVGPAGSYRVPMHGGVRSQYELRDVSTDGNQLPTAAFIVDGNGGEYRKSAHGTGKGFAMLVLSPKSFGLQPMMINTKNPNGGTKPGGPIPTIRKRGWAPPNADYSPLLECPCTDRKKKVITKFTTKETGLCTTLVNSAGSCFEAVENLGLRPIVKNETSSSGPKGCSVVATQNGYEANFNPSDSKTSCGPDPSQPVRSLGTETNLGLTISVDLDEKKKRVLITMQGPADVWFGFGFGASQMKGTYAIIVDGHGEVSERTLGDHDPGTVNPISVIILSNTVTGDNQRVIVIQRPLKSSKSSFVFNARTGSMPLLSAVGSGPDLAIHKSRAASHLLLVEAHGPLCVCADGKSGTIDGFPFNNQCIAQPKSDLLALKNDICFIETYEGGLKCCRHGSFLLDADQKIPPAVDTYRMKFRLYYEPYDSQSHAFFMFWTNEYGAGEYDVPVTESGIYTTTSVFTPRDSMRKCANLADPWCAPNWNETGEVLLLRAGTHCHAPACIGTDLYLCPEGASKCDETNGKLLCSNRPIYGDGKEQRFAEPGYLAIPPCFWGSKEEGLTPPPRLKLDTKLFSIKKNNATFYHLGVMGQWQMRGAWAT